MNSVTFRVPATTANLGPGFDCLGVALGIANRVTVQRAEGIRHPAIAEAAAALFFKTAEIEPLGFAWHIEGDVPCSRGLGSSVTVRLGLLHGLNALSGAKLDATRLYELCAALEGHPDNAAPGAFGGFTVAREGMETMRCEVDPALKFVLLIPDFEVATPDARKVLPGDIPRKGAVMSTANACRITAAFFQKKYELLRGCFSDGLHQPFREPLVPFLSRAIAAGERAGALGGFLSGSGSTICCVTLAREEAVASAMLDMAPPGAHIVITTADNQGTRRIEEPDGLS